MREETLTGGLVAAFCIATLAAAALSDIWYLIVALLGVCIVAERATRTLPDRGFYLLCAGEAPVIAVGTGALLPALSLQILLFAVFLRAHDLLRSRHEAVPFAVLAGAILLIYPGMAAFRHTLLPVLAIGAGVVIASVAIALSGYQLQKTCLGEEEI